LKRWEKNSKADDKNTVCLSRHYIKEKYPQLTRLYEEIYSKGNRLYWETLDARLREYAEKAGLPYVRADDSMQRPFDAPPVIVNYFYHEEVRKSAKKEK